MFNTCILDCSFEALVEVGRVANHEGNNLATTHGVSLDECKTLCDGNGPCNSFAYCSERSGTCSQKDLMLTGTEPTFSVNNDNGRTCTTYYAKCGKGNHHNTNWGIALIFIS